MFAPKIIFVAVLLIINHFCFTDSKRLQDNDFARQFLFRGGFEPMKYYMSTNNDAYIVKRVPSPADMMIRFGKRFVPHDISFDDLDDN
ncbi:putative FMRFamide-like neuropeptide [Dirofilaria immitis]